MIEAGWVSDDQPFSGNIYSDMFEHITEMDRIISVR